MRWPWQADGVSPGLTSLTGEFSPLCRVGGYEVSVRWGACQLRRNVPLARWEHFAQLFWRHPFVPELRRQVQTRRTPDHGGAMQLDRALNDLSHETR